MSVKPIMKEVLFFSRKSEQATSADTQVALDLLYTLQAHKPTMSGKKR